MFLTLKVVKKNILIPKGPLFQLISIFVLSLFLNIGETKARQQPVAEGKYEARYENGSIKERGFYLKGQKHKTWYYYNPDGTLDHKEKWRNGALQWQIFYSSKGRVIKTIDKNGVVKTRPACGC
jgi:hypothetical protein